MKRNLVFVLLVCALPSLGAFAGAEEPAPKEVFEYKAVPYNSTDDQKLPELLRDLPEGVKKKIIALPESKKNQLFKVVREQEKYCFSAERLNEDYEGRVDRHERTHDCGVPLARVIVELGITPTPPVGKGCNKEAWKNGFIEGLAGQTTIAMPRANAPLPGCVVGKIAEVGALGCEGYREKPGRKNEFATEENLNCCLMAYQEGIQKLAKYIKNRDKLWKKDTYPSDNKPLDLCMSQFRAGREDAGPVCEHSTAKKGQLDCPTLSISTAEARYLGCYMAGVNYRLYGDPEDKNEPGCVRDPKFAESVQNQLGKISNAEKPKETRDGESSPPEKSSSGPASAGNASH